MAKTIDQLVADQLGIQVLQLLRQQAELEALREQLAAVVPTPVPTAAKE